MTTANANIRLTKAIKKLEKPRPLKAPSSRNLLEGRLTSADEVMALVDAVSSHLTSGNYNKVLQMNIMALGQNMKAYGPQVEQIYKDQLDRSYVTFRNGCRDNRLDICSRTLLLELIELRADSWNECDNMYNYYRLKLGSYESDAVSAQESPTLLSPACAVSPTSTQPPVLSPGEVIKPSGKFAKPTKIPGKNYCKDEVVIRNSDSGKVMGIKGRRVHMIEELSETVISFQRVNPGAKERLVQITGPHEDRISYAKQLIEDTIRRNASPIRLEQAEKERGVGGSSSSLNSSASDDSKGVAQGGTRSRLLHSFSTNDASLGEYKYTVTIGNQSVKITGTNLDLVRTSKLVLDEYFTGETEQSVGAGDYYTAYEEEPSTPSAMAPVSAAGLFGPASRVNSMDSAATSESEETYKAVSLSMPTPSAAAGDAVDQLAAVRQPMFSDVPVDTFADTEQPERCLDASARDRRALFAQGQLGGLESGPAAATATRAAACPRYTRENLLEMALSKHSGAVPRDWDFINREYPAIVRKVLCAEGYESYNGYYKHYSY